MAGGMSAKVSSNEVDLNHFQAGYLVKFFADIDLRERPGTMISAITPVS